MEETNRHSEPTELEACQAQVQEWKNRSLQIAADFENFKRRSERDRIQWMGIGQTAVVTDVLPIIDDIERALIESQKKEQEIVQMQPFVSGLKMLQDALYSLLKKYNVQEIKQTVQFDPQLHEALMHVDAPEHESGTIVQVLQKGYMHHEQVLRPAKVSVAK